eukprot:gene11440-12474_t
MFTAQPALSSSIGIVRGIWFDSFGGIYLTESYNVRYIYPITASPTITPSATPTFTPSIQPTYAPSATPTA